MKEFGGMVRRYPGDEPDLTACPSCGFFERGLEINFVGCLSRTSGSDLVLRGDEKVTWCLRVVVRRCECLSSSAAEL